jgi:hypothetical protein
MQLMLYDMPHVRRGFVRRGFVGRGFVGRGLGFSFH